MRKAHRLARQRHRPPPRKLSPQQREKLRTLALPGAILTGVALVFRFVGFHRASEAVAAMNFADMSHEQEVTKALLVVTKRMAHAGDMLSIGNLVLLVGGALVTCAWTVGQFRLRWFVRMTLVFSLLLFWQPFVGTFFGLWWFWLLLKHRSSSSVKQAILIAE